MYSILKFSAQYSGMLRILRSAMIDSDDDSAGGVTWCGSQYDMVSDDLEIVCGFLEQCCSLVFVTGLAALCWMEHSTQQCARDLCLPQGGPHCRRLQSTVQLKARALEERALTQHVGDGLQ